MKNKSKMYLNARGRLGFFSHLLTRHCMLVTLGTVQIDTFNCCVLFLINSNRENTHCRHIHSMI